MLEHTGPLVRLEWPNAGRSADKGGGRNSGSSRPKRFEGNSPTGWASFLAVESWSAAKYAVKIIDDANQERDAADQDRQPEYIVHHKG